MATFVALYRGARVGDARLVAVSADPHLVADVSTRLLDVPPAAQRETDPVLSCLDSGRHAALRVIAKEAVSGC